MQPTYLHVTRNTNRRESSSNHSRWSVLGTAGSPNATTSGPFCCTWPASGVLLARVDPYPPPQNCDKVFCIQNFCEEDSVCASPTSVFLGYLLFRCSLAQNFRLHFLLIYFCLHLEGLPGNPGHSPPFGKSGEETVQASVTLPWEYASLRHNLPLLSSHS